MVVAVGDTGPAGSRGDTRSAGGSGTEVGAGDRGAAGWLAGFVFGALAIALGAMVVLHLLGFGRLDPLVTTVSDFVSIPGGAVLLDVAVLAVAAAAAAIPVGLRLRKALWIPYGIGCLGLIATLVFPTNALDTAVDTSAVVHRYVAGVFFVSLAIAALLTTTPHTRARNWTTAGIGVGILFLISHVPLLWPDWPGSPEIATILPRGLAERGLLLTDMALLASMAKRVTR